MSKPTSSSRNQREGLYAGHASRKAVRVSRQQKEFICRPSLRACVPDADLAKLVMRHRCHGRFD
jgi:hypothetical protein